MSRNKMYYLICNRWMVELWSSYHLTTVPSHSNSWKYSGHVHCLVARWPSVETETCFHQTKQIPDGDRSTLKWPMPRGRPVHFLMHSVYWFEKEKKVHWHCMTDKCDAVLVKKIIRSSSISSFRTGCKNWLLMGQVNKQRKSMDKRDKTKTKVKMRKSQNLSQYCTLLDQHDSLGSIVALQSSS